MPSALVKKTAAYVKMKLMGEHTGHDWYHVERVWKTAKRLQAEEGGDLELVELAALLHDLGDDKSFEYNEIKGLFVLHGMMDVLDFEEELKEKVVEVIRETQYAGDETKPPKMIEAKIVQDADWLDALGAIGIARTFATGGRIKRQLYDPEKKPRERLTRKEYLYRKQEGTSFNYFYEKAMKLPAMMSTKTAKEIASHRVKCVENFLREFLAEWDGKK